MSFFNSKPWAKIPTDLLENKAMNRAEKMLAPELKSAPVLLYLAGATKADDDGIFDIGDGEEFASLIKVESPENVRQVAEAMVKLRIFAHVPESSIFLFVEWEYTTRQAGKTLRNRFNTACELWKARQEEASFFNPKSTNVDTVRNDIKALQNKRFNTILHEVNECSDTIQPAPDENPQNRREREDKRETEQIIPEVEKNTHTRVEGVGGEELPSASEPLQGSSASGIESSSENEQSSEDSERLITVPNWTIAPESDASEKPLSSDIDKEKVDASSMPEENEKIKGEVVGVFNAFFQKVNIAYNTAKGMKIVEAAATELVGSVKKLEDAPALARSMCAEFQKMHDAPEPNKWHGIPLYPAYMTKETVWQALLSRAKLPDNNTVTYAHPLTEEEREETNRWLNQQFEDYGIDPDGPNAMMKLVLARQASVQAEGQ